MADAIGRLVQKLDTCYDNALEEIADRKNEAIEDREALRREICTYMMDRSSPIPIIPSNATPIRGHRAPTNCGELKIRELRATVGAMREHEGA